MNPDDRLDAVKTAIETALFDEVFDSEEVNISSADLYSAMKKAYDLGIEAENSRLFYPRIIWGVLCGIVGYIVAFAVIL